MDIILDGRKTIVWQMKEIRPHTIFRVTGTELKQALNPPHDIASGRSSAYARARTLSSNESIAVLGASEGATLYECQTVGDATLTPNMAKLMDASKLWEVRLVNGGEWFPARAIQITPTSVGWKVIVEVTAQ